MLQAADADEAKNDTVAAIDESDDDLCEVEIPFTIIDNGSSDDKKLEQHQKSSNSNNHTDKLINESAIIDCFNFSVNAHIKGKFEHVLTTNNDANITAADESNDMGKCNDEKEGTMEQHPAKASKPDPDSNECEKDWFPTPLPLPAWAASD